MFPLFDPFTFASNGSGNVSNVFSLGGSNSGIANVPVTPPSATISLSDRARDVQLTIFFSANTGAANVYQSAQNLQSGLNTAWQVPAGFHFLIQQVCSENNTVGTIVTGGGYSDNAPNNDATVPTNPIYFTRAGVGSFLFPGSTIGDKCYNINQVIPSSKYPFVENITGGGSFFTRWHGYLKAN